MIIALGGGSAMDEAKFIGVGALYDGDPWDFPLGKAVIEKTIGHHRSDDSRHLV